ncbi:hypothetical protein GobsT_58810 [Gemmata obscuriglobus]|uniref:PilZ domain-containing protein n=1 Tax=Gemmata obscuriglobus TaxID=114 RepID=A0A2Z3GSK1_9BACT|nr:PilZ domain-containing protein [Gemmata obscuriglobus]AWM36328.1 PilZ domain-containing protein [Gemmata obscuriglobus]QEG31060.1 hypothetical protein GobsT_58810 [Gemmata obscuriglobus]VTS10397.1 hypothetical protein : : PilZ [Gemmata obscuriglobus UQM 2246]
MNQLLDAVPTRAHERRRSARFQPAFGTVCRVGPANARRTSGLVWDLSATGVSMLMADPPAEGELVPAELVMEVGTERLTVELIVVHVRPVSTGDYFVGARFERSLSADEMAPFVTPDASRPLPAAPLSA